jgi:Leucine-rich repeat (LRR) protein
MQKILAEYIRISKSLKVLSMNSCQIGDEIMASIGKGMQVNENIESLSIKHNNISDEGMVEIIKAFSENEHLKLKSLDFSSNKLSDICGVKLANSLTSLSTL